MLNFDKLPALAAQHLTHLTLHDSLRSSSHWADQRIGTRSVQEQKNSRSESGFSFLHKPHASAQPERSKHIHPSQRREWTLIIFDIATYFQIIRGPVQIKNAQGLDGMYQESTQILGSGRLLSTFSTKGYLWIWHHSNMDFRIGPFSLYNFQSVAETERFMEKRSV